MASEARRTPSISAPRNYVYKHVYIYFSAAGQARAVGSIEGGNLVYGLLYTLVLDYRITQLKTCSLRL